MQLTSGVGIFTHVCGQKTGHFKQLLCLVYKFYYCNDELPTIFSKFFNLNSEMHTYYTRSSNNLHSPLLPENTNVDIVDECSNIREWADSNGMVINLHKTKEIVLHRHHPRRWSLSKSLEGIEQVQSAKLLGVIFQSTFSFIDHC